MTIATKPSRKDYMTAKPSRLDYSKPSRKEYTVGVGPMWDEPGDTRTMRERLGYEKKKPITAGDAAQAVTETPENLWIGTVGMSASVLEAIKREGMRYAGGGILPDENVRRQFEAVKPPDVLPSTGQPLPGAITAEAFGLITRLPDVGAKIVRDYQQEKMKDQVTLDDAPITKLARLVTQSGIPSMSVALGISVLTRNPIAGLGILGTIEGGAAFENQLQEGGSIRKSMLIGDLSAAAEIGGEMLVFPKFVKGLKTGIPLDKALKLIVENAGQEGATGFTQRFLEVFGTETTKGTDITDAARIAFNEGVKAVPENAWVGGATAGLVDLVSTGTSRILRDPDLKNKIEKKIGASPKVAARAVQMLDEGWTPAEIDRNLITPSKFLGDRAIDQIQAKERLKTEEDRQVEKDITEMDRELAEIQGQTLAETTATRGIEGLDIAQERLSAAEGVEMPTKAEISEAKPTAAEGRKARNVATGELMDLKVGDPYVDNMAVDVVAFQPFTIEGEQGAFPEGAIEVEEIGEILEAGQVIVNKRPATKSEIETRLARERKNKAAAEKLGVDTESYEKEIQRLEKALSEGKYAQPPAKEALAKAPAKPEAKAEPVQIERPEAQPTAAEGEKQAWQLTSTNKQASDLGFTRNDQAIFSMIENEGGQVNLSSVPIEDWYTYQTPEGLAFQSDREVIDEGGYSALLKKAKDILDLEEEFAQPAAAEALAQPPAKPKLDKAGRTLEQRRKQMQTAALERSRPITELSETEKTELIGLEAGQTKITVYRGIGDVEGASLERGDFVTTDKSAAKTIYGPNLIQDTVNIEDLRYFRGRPRIPDIPTAKQPPVLELVYAPAEPEAKIKDPDKYREGLQKKWGEEKFDKVWFELAEGGENERFSDIDSRVAELDEQDKFDSPEAKRLRIEMDSIVDAELEKRAAELTQPPEKPSELTKPSETAPKVTGTEEVTDEELGGITKRERRRLIKENAAKIEASDIYQNEVAAMETMASEVGAGYYYIDKGYRGEVEAIIGKRKGFPTAIQRMFTFNPDEKRIITLPDGNKAAVGPTPWERSVQEGLGRYKEGVDQTWGEMDISEFVQRVVDAYNAYEKIGGVYKGPLERTEETGRPDEQMLAEKHRMLVAGISDHEINKMITEWAEEWGIAIEDIEDEFINEYGTRIRQIKRMEDPDAALEQLAAEQIEREDRQAAAEAAREVLEANDIQAEIEQVEEISERPIDLIGRPLLQGGAAGKQRGLGELGLEFKKTDVKDPDQLEFGQLPEKPVDDIPFERRGRPVGVAITQGQKQVILLAYGADSETGYHEGYHILRRRLTDKDTRVLDKYFKGDEEAEARAFAEFAKTGKTRTFMRGIWQKLLNVLRKVKSGMMGRGFRTADDIFAGIRSGKIEKAPAKGGVAFETSGEKARREVEKKARIKARAARIAADNKIKTKKKAKAPRIKLNIRDVTPLLGKEYQEGAPRYRRKEPPLKIPIKDVTPALTADLALAEKGIAMEPSEERPLTTKPTVETVYDEKWFQANLKKERRSVLDRGSSEAKSAWLGAEKIFSPISTRLNNIAPKLFRETRQFVYNYLTRSTGMIEDVKGFVNATRKMSKEDWRMLDLALKNGVKWKTDEIVGKYGLTEEYNNVRDTLDEIFSAAKEVGIDIEYMKNYWPRVLKDPEGFLMYFQGREDWSIIEEAIKRRAKQAGRKVEDLTVDEKAHVINTLLRGFQTQALTLSRPGAAKERTVETVHKEIDAFYADSRSALYRYIKIMNAKIAEREFFGRETKQIQALRKTQSARLTRLMKLKRRVGLKYPSEPKYKEHISKTAQAWKDGQERLERLKARPMSETIGGYVMRLQAAGEISPTQEKEVQDLLRAIFDPKRMGKRMSMFAAGVYIDTLNSPLQAMTQLDEFAYSFYRSPLRSIPIAIRTAARKSKITPRDIGITSIGEEFQGPSAQRFLSLLLKSTGFEMVDRLNKENYINTVLNKYQAQAKRKNLNADFLNRVRKVFGEDYKGVLEDLRNNRISDNVKYLLFNEILDIQPVAITEMPEYYNRAGNLRILYALKTFYIRRLDFIRNECFKDMKSSKTFARGFGKLVWLAGSFALMGAGSDFLKDFIRGKPFDIKDSIADNMLRMAFFSKYQAWRTREKGLGTALLEGWRPPTKAIDALTRDIINEAQGKERGWELWRSVPIVGEEYYWWFGEGRRKVEKQQKKSPVD